MSEKRKQYVVWSGGADSTYLLYTLAKKSSKDCPVHTISVHHEYVDDKKLIKEKEARKNILKWMKDQAFHIKTHNIHIKTTQELYDSSGRQPLMWLCAIMPTVPLHSDIHFGYVYEDSIWHVKEGFKEAFKWLDETRVHQGTCKLYFDLEWVHKKEIIRELKKLGLYKLIWTCEEPTKTLRRCGRCSPCKTEKRIIRGLKDE